MYLNLQKTLKHSFLKIISEVQYDEKNIFENFGSFWDQGKSSTKKSDSSPLTWEKFVEKTGKDIDNRLIAHAKKEGLVYVGGKCRFTVTASEQDENKFILNVDVELYYKDQFKAEKNFQIYPLHTERCFEEFALDDEETKNQLEKLKTEQYEFKVETPQIKSEKE